MEWIAETLHVFGFINREHLERKFGISTPQASADLQEFQRRHAFVMRYDSTRKCYVETAEALGERAIAERTRNKNSDNR